MKMKLSRLSLGGAAALILTPIFALWDATHGSRRPACRRSRISRRCWPKPQRRNPSGVIPGRQRAKTEAYTKAR